jgi:hypothetical protein
MDGKIDKQMDAQWDECKDTEEIDKQTDGWRYSQIDRQTD